MIASGSRQKKLRNYLNPAKGEKTMDGKTIGLAVGGNKVTDVQAAVKQAGQAGIQAVWMTTGGARLDSITLFAAAAGGTADIKFGTSIVPI